MQEREPCLRKFRVSVSGFLHHDGRRKQFIRLPLVGPPLTRTLLLRCDIQVVLVQPANKIADDCRFEIDARSHTR